MRRACASLAHRDVSLQAAERGHRGASARRRRLERFIIMLLMWILAFPVWLVVFIALYALATLYVAIKYREVRKFLSGAFFVSSGTCWYLWVTGVSLPIVLPYVGTVSVETPEISGQRAIVHFVFISKPKQSK